jgi:hypothetical protein
MFVSLLSGFALSTQADVITVYGFQDPDDGTATVGTLAADADSTAVGITPGVATLHDFDTDGGGGGEGSGSIALNDQGGGNFTVRGDESQSYSIDFTLTVAPSQTLTLDGFEILAYGQRNSSGKVLVNGNEFSTFSIPEESSLQPLVGTTASSLTGLTGDVDVRVIFTPPSSSRFIFVDDVTLTGVIPEPASLSLLAAGGVCLLGRRRRGA